MNFLDVTLDLDTGSHKPFHKSNEDLKYVNKDSNHPPVVINNKELKIVQSYGLEDNTEPYIYTEFT